MSTRQKIIKFLKEGKTPSEVLNLLKDEKVSNIKSYISIVHKNLQNNKLTNRKIKKYKSKRILKSSKVVCCKCVECKKIYDIYTNSRDLYSLDIVRNNWVCIRCSFKVKRVLLRVLCIKCGMLIATKVLESNKDKYKDFKCYKCNEE